MSDARQAQLGRLLARIRVGLRDEVDTQPGQRRIYGRLHESGRSHNVPRYSSTGDRIPGVVHYAADCDHPENGACPHIDGGSWRPVPGVARPDAMAAQGAYELDRREGLIYCLRPYRRALERLYAEGDSHRRHDVLRRLLEGYSVGAAWTGLGKPVDPLGSSLAIAEQVERMATEEAWRVREPREKASWMDKSESQRQAEIEVQANAIA